MKGQVSQTKFGNYFLPQHQSIKTKPRRGAGKEKLFWPSVLCLALFSHGDAPLLTGGKDTGFRETCRIPIPSQEASNYSRLLPGEES